jgi:hypothetical protein
MKRPAAAQVRRDGELANAVAKYKAKCMHW